MGSEWIETNLGTLLKFSNGKSSPPRSDEYPVLVYGSNGIIGHCIESNAQAETIIIGRVGSYCGSIYLSKEECWVTDNAIKANTLEGNNPRFLFYLLNLLDLNNWATGSGQPLLNQSILKSIDVTTPPLPEQKGIAHVLGTFDDKIELNRRMNATLEGMAQALFKSWFVDFDPVIDNALAAGNPIPEELAGRAEVRRQALADGTANREASKQFPAAFQFNEEMGWIPDGWEMKDFGDVSLCIDRKRIPLSKKQREEKKPGHIPYYGATSIMDYINEWIFEDTFLLIGEDGSKLKEDGSPFVQYIWGKSWVNNHAHVLQGTSGISTEHLMLFMLSQNITAYVTGAVQLKLNQKNMNSIPFLKAEDKINQNFTDHISPLYQQLKLLTEENRTLAKLRDTLLPKLISGELRISEAENYLDRITN